MYKIASVALTAALGVAGVTQSVPAEAHPYVSVGIALPGIAVVAPFEYASPYYGYAPAYHGPYYYAPGWYWRRDFDHDRFHPRWDRGGDHHWDRR